jgi:hypothetical protein
MSVTKARLDALRNQHTVMNTELHLRPDDASVAYVHSSIDAERIGELNRGDRIMQFAHNQFSEAMQKAREQGLRRAQSNRQALTRQQTQQHTHALSQG